MNIDEYVFTTDDFIDAREYPSKFFFLSKKFLAVQSKQKIQFSVNHKGKIVLTLTFSLLKDVAVSPYKASFGGINEIESIPKSILLAFITFFRNELKNRRMKNILVSLPPEIYSASSGAMLALFLASGWKLKESDRGFYLNLRGEKGFWEGLDSSAKNKLNKATKSGYVAEKLDKKSIKDAYNILVANRAEKRYPVTMSYDDLYFMLRNFKEYQLFGAFQADKMVAMAVCIAVSPKVVYLFYLADLYSYRSYSPNVLLLNYIYNHYYELGFAVFDLGLASEKSTINRGLSVFKKNMGGKLTRKYTLQSVSN